MTGVNEAFAATAATEGVVHAAGGVVFALLGCFGFLLVAVGTFLRSRTGEVAEKYGDGPVPAIMAVKACRWNAAVVTLTAVTLAVSLWNLGGHAAPETSWQAAKAGESVTVELGRPAELSAICYYSGINERKYDGGRFSLAARTPDGSFVPLLSFTRDDMVGAWKRLDVAVRTDAVRLTAETPGGRINELAFVEKGSEKPLPAIGIGEKNVSGSDGGRAENLVDEQRAFEPVPSFRTGFYFDEIYHARTAWEMLHGIDPFETTHPPLGKLFISAGIALFGMNGFGWRVAGALFGVSLVPLIYLFGLKLFRDRFFASCAALLMAADFMRFTQSRVAVIDVYGVFFVLLVYYFIIDLFPRKGEGTSRSTERTLFLAGLAFGIGAACKWIALYAGAGVALLTVLRTAIDLKRRNFPAGRNAGRFLARRVAVCILAFGINPAGIYILSYLPYLAFTAPGDFIPSILRLQAHMLHYHRTLHATHPFSSQWWSWPLDLRPMWLYSGEGLPDGRVSTIASFGNPAVWWPAIPAAVAAAVVAVRRRDARIGIVLAALTFQYLPWVGINRLAFIYHFFSAVPFVILCIVTLLQAAEERYPQFRTVTLCYLGLAVALFVHFYPVLSGMEVRKEYVAALKWLPTWVF
jgi:dolichyl-phosphate-mannose-protein mannosyltransferase